MANRYSQISTSQFDPLSLQEVLTVPLYKQKLYDQLEADRVATQEAFKVDPLDVHKDEAQRLQNDFNAKADELARYQLKTGDLQGAKTKMLDLRKEYKRLMDPMGDVSKINNANKALKEEQTRFLEAATKQYGSTRALELWNQHKNTYKGYDDKGNIQNINSRGIVANQDFMKDVKEFHDLMGKTTSSIAGSGYNIVERPEGLVMVNSSGKTVTNNNFEQLKSAEKALKSKWINPTGEGTLFNIEAGKNPQEFENYFKNTMYSQRESSVTRDSDTSASFIGDKTSKTKTTDPNMTAYNLGDGQLNITNQELLKETGLYNGGIEGFTKEERNNQSPFNAPLFKISVNGKSNEKSQKYKNLASSINRTLPSNQKFKTGSKEEDAAVKAYLTKYGNTVIQNRLVDPFSDETGLLFADKTIGKEAKAAQENLKKRVAIKASKMVYDDGTEVPSYLLPTFSYNGDLTAESNINVFKEDKRQNYLAHTGTVKIGKDNDAKIKTVYISRNSDDFNKPQYKGGVDKNKINNIVSSQPNIYHNFKPNTINAFKNYGMKDVEVKYNENSKTYDVSYKENDGSNIDIKFDNDQNGTAETKFNKWLIKLNE